jgi:hypothetical protein
MWAYFGESQNVPTLRVVVYTPDRPSCEVNRAKDMKMPPAAAWAGIKVPAECHQVAIGSGTDYWVYTYPKFGAMGATDRDWCLKMREVGAQTYRGWLGECQPVGLRLLQ